MRRFRSEYSVNDRQEVKNEINQLKLEMMQFYAKQIEENIVMQPKYVNYA